MIEVLLLHAKRPSRMLVAVASREVGDGNSSQERTQLLVFNDCFFLYFFWGVLHADTALERRAVGNFEEKESHDAAPLAHSPH